MARGEAEALEYACNNGSTKVRLLSVEEGKSYRGTDVIVTASRVSYQGGPLLPQPERDGDSFFAPCQLETRVALNLQYRMVK